MSTDAWHLPWGPDSVPHGLLDIIRGCNISCTACYNGLPPRAKPLADIERDLDVLCRHRRIQSVSIVGGEVLLHPAVCDVVRMVKKRGLCVEMFTNGVLLDDRVAARLGCAGLDLIFIHVEEGQRRPDLPDAATAEQRAEMRRAKAETAARHGLDVGLSLTAREGRLREVRDAVEFVLESPHANYLLVTLFRDHANYAEVRGDLCGGMRGALIDSAAKRGDNLTNVAMAQYMREAFGLTPFAVLGSNLDRDDPRWLSFLVATARGPDGKMRRHGLRAAGFERAYIAAARRVTGRYPMYRPQKSTQLAVQVFLNALTGGDLRGNLGFLLRSGRGAVFKAKRLLFQCPAEILADGRVVHCLNCPDAVAVGPRLVPVCLADKVVESGKLC